MQLQTSYSDEERLLLMVRTSYFKPFLSFMETYKFKILKDMFIFRNVVIIYSILFSLIYA